MENTSTQKTTSVHTWGTRQPATPTENEWRKALDTIESQDLDIRLNVVSDFGAFFKAVSREPAARLLVSAMLASGDVREEVLGHLNDLAHLDVDPRYQHPYDTAMAILVWATYYTAPHQAYRAASAIERTARTWYSRKLAGRLMNPAPNGTGNMPDHPEQPKVPVFDVWPRETSHVYTGPLRLAAGTAGP